MKSEYIINKKTQVPVISLVGWSGSGKTTIIEKLSPILKERGYKIGIIKHHAHNEFDIDVPGKDTWRYAKAGADSVAMISPIKLFIHQTTTSEMSLSEVVDIMSDNDIIITEGFSWENTIKIEVIRKDNKSTLKHDSSELIALISDFKIETETDLPILDINEIDDIADFVIKNLYI